MDDHATFGQQTEKIPSCTKLEATWLPLLVPSECILCFTATGPLFPNTRWKTFNPFLIHNLQNFSNEGENPHAANVSLLIITVFFSLSFHWPRISQRINLPSLEQTDLDSETYVNYPDFQAANYQLQEHHPWTKSQLSLQLLLCFSPPSVSLMPVQTDHFQIQAEQASLCRRTPHFHKLLIRVKRFTLPRWDDKLFCLWSQVDSPFSSWVTAAALDY